MQKQKSDDKICKYINCHVPIEYCNLRCGYCYIRQAREFNPKDTIDYSPDFIRRALSKERLGGTVLFTLCGGGETMLCNSLGDIVEALIQEGHYVHIVTNGTITKAVDDLFSRNIDFEHIMFKLSLHYLELKRLNLLETFAENFRKIKAAGASASIEVMAYDKLVSSIDELKGYSLKNFQAFPHIAPAREDKSLNILTDYTLENYCEIWGQFQSALFDYKMKKIVYVKREEFCKAGEWALQMDLGSGDMYQCIKHPYLDNLYQNIDSEIKLKAVGIQCCLPYCQNGHIYLPLGVLPEIDAPSYLELRNRKMTGGGEWVTGKMKSILSQKLFQNNS